MNTIAQDIFKIRYEEVRKKLLSGKIRNKELVRTWLYRMAERAALEAEKETRNICSSRFRDIMSRQSIFEMADLMSCRDEEEKEQ